MSLAGAHRIAIPTPFQVGPVNAYLLEGPPRTLVDVGPHTDEARGALESGLSAFGVAPGEIALLLITHPHIDHFGLAGWLKAQSGCRVVAHPHAVPKLADFAGYYAREQDYFKGELVAWGMPEQAAQLLTEIPKGFAVLAPPVAVDETLSEGDSIRIGPLALDVLETPGHSPGSLSFHARAHKALFAGDHLIRGITPNPLLEMPLPATGKRPQSLIEYVGALEKVAALDLEAVYSGHRETITDPAAVIRDDFGHIEARAERVLGLLAAEGPLTPYALMGKLFPQLPATEQFLGMSEAVGHLERLEALGQVRCTVRGGERRYAPA